MSRRVRLGILLLGLALFVYLVARIGLRTLAADAAATGWWIVPILLVYGVVYAGNALAWRIVMAGEPGRPSFLQTYALTISGFALNYLTPVVSLGGEPYKAAAVSEAMGARRAAGSVVLYTMLHTLSHLLIWLLATGVALAILPHSPALTAGLVALAALLAGLIALVFSGHRNGVLEGALNLLHRIPLLHRAAHALEGRRELLIGMDEQIVSFYRRDRGRFFLALGVDTAARAVGMLEFYLILASLGNPVSYAKAFLLGGMSTAFLNLFFFVPYELGSREGGMYLIYNLLGLDPGWGVYTVIVNRLREVAWIGVGLLLLPLGRARRAAGAAASERGAGAAAGRPLDTPFSRAEDRPAGASPPTLGRTHEDRDPVLLGMKLSAPGRRSGGRAEEGVGGRLEADRG